MMISNTKAKADMTVLILTIWFKKYKQSSKAAAELIHDVPWTQHDSSCLVRLSTTSPMSVSTSFDQSMHSLVPDTSLIRP